jgi:lipopolysaccharide transport system ATP-binding protein
VDEVLAVGDLAFQAKCLARMAEMKRLGVTILIVSHQLPRLRRLCDRGIFLHRGELVVDGPIDEAIVAYQAHQESGARTADSPGSEAGEPPKSSILAASPVALTQVAVLDGLGQPSAVCQAGGRLVVRVSYHARQSVESPICEVWVHAADGTEFACCTTRWDGVAWGPIEGDGHIDLAFDPVCLAAGRYLISAAITAADGITRYDWHWQRYTLEIATSHSMQGLVYQPHEWRLGVQ